ncbi:ABC transporter ATP-binding protein [Lederbergia lenta]|uniref:ABC transporter ATP-binding protein/permease n=1 Tax=Lederbergia lenta TaxID=1467 RepID=A0A2X4WK37_LEDLE|nr:ABC transporter ATP-binding protein [Lederbergia lenta]MCM3112930.1 ABC transporter ATP-binding protein/permease [Lederbergia lenta]MEC2326103.1 ABC transporter ATP-binding protein [Lederbergia lenta]SQI63471.1 ABC transporter ATP-binding protein/permease [Lederbergia lenta]
MRKLIRYLKPHWLFVLFAPLLMVLEVAMDLLQPRLMASIIDEGVMKGNLSLVQSTGSWMLLVAFIGLLGGIGCTIFASYASVYFAADLREDLYKRVQSFAFKQLDRFSGGQLVTRLTNDVTQLQLFVEMILKIFVRSPLLTIGSIIMAIMISPKLAIILIASVPLLFIVLFLLIRYAFPLFSKVQEKLDGVNNVLQENLRGMRLVKAFVRGDFEQKKFREQNTNYTEFAVKAFRIMALNMPVMMLIMNITIVAVLWFGAGQTWTGNLPVGELVAFINYVTQVLFSLLMAGMLMMAVSRAKASADRVNEVLIIEPERQSSVVQPIDHVRGHIEFNNVSFAYDKDQDLILDAVSFEAKPGQTLAILGAAGAGKSTLIQLIPGLYEATEGTVLLDGKNVLDLPLDELRKHIGYVLQETILFSGTIYENISFGKSDATQEEVDAAAKAAQAHEFISRMPNGYETNLGQRGVNLSGGQKQRIAIARALLLNPAILILDDSTSAVDVKTETAIQKALKTEWRHTTCIFIAQRISSVVEADHIIVMENGKIAAEGKHKQLLEESALYQDIFASQQRKEEIVHG